MAHIQTLAARARGTFLGAAVGDALGWPQEQNSGIVGGNRNRYIDPAPEFRDWVRYAGGTYQKYVDPVIAGSYSDDTQLVLATARALQTDDWYTALTRTELPLFLLYSRGAGGATLRACRAWSAGSPPWDSGTTQKSQKAADSYFRAGGNGVAMRIAPHVVHHAARPTSDLVARIVHDGISTHGHPRALVGAAAYAVALHTLLNTDGTLEFGELPALVIADKAWQDPELLVASVPSEWLDAAAARSSDFFGAWEATVKEMLNLLGTVVDTAKAGTRGDDMKTLEQLGVFDKKVNGSGTVTTAAAIYLASRYAPRPMSGILRAAFVRNADTDTVASMTAALLGALHGPECLADLRTRVQDRNYIERAADDMTARALGEERITRAATAVVDDRSLAHFRDTLSKKRNSDGFIQLPDKREGRLKDELELEPSGNVRAHRWVLDVEGQTLVVDHATKLTAAEIAERKRNEAKKDESASPPSPSPTPGVSSRFARVTLRAANLDALESFYAKEVGLPVRRVGPNELLVDDAVRFFKDANATFGSSRILLTFDVEDVAAVARRLGHGTRDLWDTLRSSDPDGNDLEIRPVKRP